MYVTIEVITAQSLHLLVFAAHDWTKSRLRHSSYNISQRLCDVAQTSSNGLQGSLKTFAEGIANVAQDAYVSMI